jgi:hypothetical protein
LLEGFKRQGVHVVEPIGAEVEISASERETLLRNGKGVA